MHTLSCHYRDHLITARVETHSGLVTPYAGGCAITDPDGHTGRRVPLPYSGHFMADLDNAQHASLAHGRWLVDQKLGPAH